MTFDIASYSKLELLRQSLEQRGFTQSHEDDVICRFRYQELIIDVMSTTAVGWAPSNPWFGPGFEQAVTFKIDTHFIQLMPLPYFFASKLVAFFDRGIQDPVISHDFEDIVYLLNYVSDIVEQINSSKLHVHRYIQEKFNKILSTENLKQAMRAHLFYEFQDDRLEMIMTKIQSVVNYLK